MGKVKNQYDKKSKLVTIYLSTLLIALIVVGFETGTILRHVVQIIPIAISVILVRQQIKWSSFAALGVFIVWFIIMCFIWLHLLDIAHIVHGRFTVIEIILTIVIAISCLLGTLNALRNASIQNWVSLSVIFLFFLVLQFFSVWLSMRPPIADR